MLTSKETLERRGCSSFLVSSAGIFKQSMEGSEPSMNVDVIPARQAAQPGGISSSESILGSLKV
jgi:hypothetical protein